MKHIQTSIIILFSCLIFAGCNFSKGTKKDLRTGLSYNYNGFRVEDVLLVDAADKRMTDNKVQLNTKVNIIAIGLDNYGLKDGKAFPGMMLLVTNKNGKAILEAADLFKDTEGFLPAQAGDLRGSVTIGSPMVSGETYHVKLHIWDKVTADNELNVQTDLVVQ